MMRPAFGSIRSAAAFALLLLAVLLSPLLIGKSLLPPREQSYASQSWGSGPYPYLRHQIFEEKGDIDILFIGSSHILHCLDARRLQDELGRRLGRPATVRVLGWGGAGYDALYFITKDLLAHRRVRMLVFYDEQSPAGRRNAMSPIWFRFQEDAGALKGLPASEQAYYYFAALVGLPKNLICLLRPNLPTDLNGNNYWIDHYGSTNLTASLGSTMSELAFNSRPYQDVDHSIPFVPFTPVAGAAPDDALMYSPATQAGFHFASEKLAPQETHFIRLFSALAARQNCRLVMLHIPDLAAVRNAKIEERTFWPDYFGTNLVMLGVPPAKMFGKLSDEEVRKLFFNPGHFNQNGLEYFTSLILPSLLQIYETSVRH